MIAFVLLVRDRSGGFFGFNATFIFYRIPLPSKIAINQTTTSQTQAIKIKGISYSGIKTLQVRLRLTRYISASDI